MKIRDAIAALGYEETASESLCITRFRGDQKKNRTLRECHDAELSPRQGHLYVATGAFLPDTIKEDSGRKRDNLVRVVDLPFDFDLTDYLKAPKDALWNLDAATLGTHLSALYEDAGEVLSILRVPVWMWLNTGYGLLALARLNTSDQKDIEGAQALHAHLVGRVNEVFGDRLADPQVKDAGTRLIRLPYSYNVKGPEPREVVVYEEVGESFLHLADYEGQTRTPRPPRRIIPDHALSLSTDDERNIILALNNCWTEGSRHGLALGVSGMLAKAGVPEEQAERIIAAASAGDDEPHDRLAAVKTSYQRVRMGLDVRGFMALRDLAPQETAYIDNLLTKVRPKTLGFIDFTPTEREAGALTRPGFAECPEEGFYGWFGEYRQIMSTTTEASDAFHLGAAMVSAGSCVGRRVATSLGRTLHANLFLTLVGETGKSRKDTAISRAEYFFLQNQTPDFLLQHPFSLLRGVRSGEGLIDHLETSPTTVLRLSELSTFVRKARQEGSITLMPTMLELWDAPPRIDIARAGKDGRKSVENPFLSLLAATTPQTLAEDMTAADIESGFANRVLWFFGTGKAPIPDPDPPDPAKCAYLYNELLRTIGNYPHGTVLTKTAQAKDLWQHWYLDEYRKEYRSQDEAQMAQRMGANIHRIALIFAVSDGAPFIEEHHLSAAIAIVEWQFANVKAQARRWGWNDEAKLGIAIQDALFCGPLSGSQLSEAVGERWGPTTVQRTLDAMIKLGRVEIPAPGVYQLPTGAC